ncbi:class I SAM-dependent methyltransferase [Streptomyces sp. NBC_01335]|uniref:class I SAM-dependent DNA methyltransferase n=1 Tax=Streptomyces sp. NBC_01335 TaxID=2903828 RepID=UPI002E150FE0|nr:class I SAM-dependent methyltransferase [Streptomyces sp. NBC_01335]
MATIVPPDHGSVNAEPPRAEPRIAGPAYAAEFAGDYDRWFGKPNISASTVDALDDLAALAGAGRPVLELGIGTGRIALPLRARGIDVHGIDGSPAMVRQLREKPGGTEVPVTLGDFSEVPVTGEFGVVYLAAGTFFELPDQEAQSRCFEKVVPRLAPGGLFVFDAHVPEQLAAHAQGAEVVSEGEDHLVLCYRRIDASAQRYRSHYVIHEAGSTRHLRVEFRYAAHGELDLMAGRAGLRLKERWGSWAGAPFTRDSAYHVSVYEHA